MCKPADSYSNIRIETVKEVRYVEHTVLSNDPEGNAIDRVYKYAEETGIENNR